MKTYLVKIFIVLFLLLTHCTHNENAIITKEFKDFSGTYIGMLPCADCEGIKYALTLNDDGTYSEDLKYIGKANEEFQLMGEWQIRNDSVLSVASKKENKRFLCADNKLVLLDKKGRVVKSSFAEMYELKKVEEGFETMDIPPMRMGRMRMMYTPMENMESDFLARGNEPYWNLKVDFKKGIFFNTMDGAEIQASILNLDKAQNEKILRLHAPFDTGEMIVSISEVECSDAMVDENFHHSVRIEIIYRDDSEQETFEGCGEYFADVQLHDIWVVTSINGNEIRREANENLKIPVFEFFPDEGRFLGNFGCNDVNGTFYIAEKNVLQFGVLTTTDKACPKMGYENLLMKTISGKRLNYERKEMQLVLAGSDDSVIHLKKVD